MPAFIPRTLTLTRFEWDNPTLILTLDSKRRPTVPVALAWTFPGDVFEARYDEDEDEIVLRRVKRKRKSWLEVLKECPVPMDDLPPRSREQPKKLRLPGNDKHFRCPGLKVLNPFKESRET